MPLDLNMIHSAVRLIGDVPAPKLVTGMKRGPIGTGFLITVKSETHTDVRYGYCVTAAHVIDGQNRVEVQPPNPFGNGELYEPSLVEDWRQPLADVDIAIAPFEGDPSHTYMALEHENHVLPLDKMPALGATIYYIGILAPLNRPMARVGAIGALDQVGIAHDGGYVYTTHLVDCRSYGGFSGSPCFVLYSLPSLTPAEPEVPLPPDMPVKVLGQMVWIAKLCGMFTAHLEASHIEPGGVASRYGVGFMLRHNEILEALMAKELQDKRLEQDAIRAALPDDGPQPTNASTTGARMSEEDEFDRFEDLARKLVHTPKPEIEGDHDQ